MTIAEAREELRAALAAAGLGVTVMPSAPRAPAPPALVLVPRDPYFEPDHVGQSVGGTVNLDVVVFVGPSDATSELAGLESLATSAMTATPAGWTVGDLSRPEVVQLDEDGDRRALSARYPCSRRITP